MDHWVRDAWPVRRQTYAYLPSRRASPPFGRYQIILLGEQRHMRANNLPKVVTWQCFGPESIYIFMHKISLLCIPKQQPFYNPNPKTGSQDYKFLNPGSWDWIRNLRLQSLVATTMATMLRLLLLLMVPPLLTTTTTVYREVLTLHCRVAVDMYCIIVAKASSMLVYTLGSFEQYTAYNVSRKNTPATCSNNSNSINKFWHENTYKVST